MSGQNRKMVAKKQSSSTNVATVRKPYMTFRRNTEIKTIDEKCDLPSHNIGKVHKDVEKTR